MSERIDWRVPRHLDELPRLLFMDSNQAIVLLVVLAAGIALGYAFAGIALGVLAAWAFARLKSGRHPQFLLHLAYWHLPRGVAPMRSTPPAHNRIYLG